MKTLLDKLSEILTLDLEEEEKEILQKMVENLKYYRKLIPKSIEKDLHCCVDIAIKEKKLLEEFKSRCKCSLLE